MKLLEKLNENIVFLCHIFLYLFLTFSTLPFLESSQIIYYLFFGFSFLLSHVLSLWNISINKKGHFFYYISTLFSLGFFFKFSLHTIFEYDYVETIGSFDFDITSINEVLMVSSCGVWGLVCAQLTSIFIEKKTRFVRYLENFSLTSLSPSSSRWILFILLLALLCSFINIKFNILVFGRVPEVRLPLKGNILFFLFLTRGLPFLFFYHFFNRFNFLYIFAGALLMTICSVGVASRMIIVTYFFIFLVLLVSKFKDYREKIFLKNVIFGFILFVIFSIVTVYLSTNLRDSFNQKVWNSRSVSKKEIKKKSLLGITTKLFRQFSQLSVDRWIGIEGVMSVQSFSNKGKDLLISGLLEGSYRGKSFYSSISDPSRYRQFDENKKITHTSVPGPVAFSFYSGSFGITFVFIFIMGVLCNLASSSVAILIKSNTVATIFIAGFIAFDFFQFGISPISFFKNIGFSLFCILFYVLVFVRKIGRGA